MQAWAAKQPIARAARKHFSLSFSKGDLVHADQYWKYSRQVVHAEVGIPRLQFALKEAKKWGGHAWSPRSPPWRRPWSGQIVDSNFNREAL